MFFFAGVKLQPQMLIEHIKGRMCNTTQAGFILYMIVVYHAWARLLPHPLLVSLCISNDVLWSGSLHM